MYDPGTISPNHGTSPVPSGAKIKANFLSMKPSDMFKMMGALGTQTQSSNRVETKLPAPTGIIPKQLLGDDFNPGIEPKTLAESVIIAKSQWLGGVPKSEETTSKRITAPTINLNPTVEVTVLAPQCTEIQHYNTYSSTSPLNKAGSRSRFFEEAIPPAPRYSRKVISTLDGALPLNLPAPHYREFEVQTSRGTFSRKPTSYGPEIKSYCSMKVVSPTPQKEASSPLDNWNTSGATASPSTETIPKLKVADIPLLKGTLTKQASSSGFQPKGAPDVEVVTLPAILYRNETPASTRPLFEKPSLFGFDDNLRPAPVAPLKRTDRLKKSNGKLLKKLTRSGLDKSPTGSLEVEKPIKSAKGHSSYTFAQDSLFPAVANVGKIEERVVESAILKSGIVTSNPELKQMTSKRKDYMTYEEKSTATAITALFQANIVSAQNQEPKHRKDPFAKANPILKLSAAPLEIKSSENAKTQNVSNDSLSTLSGDEESDLSHSSSDEGERAEEIQPFDDVALISSKPWVKRITARRRMRQGEFSKW